MAPLLAPFLGRSIYDWNFTTTPIAGLNGQTRLYSRGKLLGGTSSISMSTCLVTNQALTHHPPDYMLYSRGSSGDWDRFADITGDQGWKWDNMLKYAFKVCAYTTFVPRSYQSSFTERKNVRPR